MSPEMTAVLMVVSLFALLATGLPIAFATAAVAVIFMILMWGPNAVSVLIGGALHNASSFVLLAIPLYVFMGTLLEKTGIADDLYKGLFALTAGIRGGLAIGTIVIGAIIAAMVGVAGGEVVILGLIALPSMLRYNYDKRIVLGTVLASGTLAQLIPPSLLFIFYGSQTGVSVGSLFAGGIIAGIFFTVLFIIYISVRSFFQKELCPLLPVQDRPSLKQKLAAIPGMLPTALLILAVLGSIFSGMATPTEAASVGVLGAFLIGLARRRITWAAMSEATRRTLIVAGMCMWIAIGGNAFASIFTALGGAIMIKGLITAAGFEPWAILAMIMVTLIVLGTFLDPISIIILTTPIFVPLANAAGYDPLWFGVVYVANLQMSYITPPFGFSIFFLKGVAPPHITTGDIYRSVWPFVLLQMLGLTLIILFPNAILWFPHLLAGLK